MVSFSWHTPLHVEVLLMKVAYNVLNAFFHIVFSAMIISAHFICPRKNHTVSDLAIEEATIRCLFFRHQTLYKQRIEFFAV